MPVTPFHFGPGLFAKALAPRSVSMTAFGAANVLIDTESVVNLVTGRTPVHALLHTFPVASAVGVAAGLLVALIGRALRRATGSEWSLRPALFGGILGGASHPLFDGLMHPDICPFLPLSGANPLLGLVGLDLLHALCAGAGAAGLAVLSWRAHRVARPSPPRG